MAGLGKVLFLLITSTLLSFASPLWITKDNCYDVKNRGKVIEVKTAQNADLVVINTGLQSNMRIGAVCSIETQTRKIAKIVIVEASQTKSVGLLITNTEVQKGDAVYITAN